MFYLYVLFLIASGVMMLAMGGFKAAYARRGRIVNLIVGTGFTVYGLYLLLFLRSGHYIIFFYAFILPILLAVRFFRDRAAAGGGRRRMGPAGYGGAPQPPAYGEGAVSPAYGNGPYGQPPQPRPQQQPPYQGGSWG
jgi:hypothetical protein